MKDLADLRKTHRQRQILHFVQDGKRDLLASTTSHAINLRRRMSRRKAGIWFSTRFSLGGRSRRSFIMLHRLLAFAGLELTPTQHLDKLISGLGGFIAIGLMVLCTRWLLGPAAVMPVVASMGASAVLLFAAPHGALSQPWPLAVGHLLSAIIGVTCCRFIGNPLVCGAAAVGLSITAMYYARAIHPPGGATALTPVLAGATLRGLGYSYVLIPVALNVVLLLLLAISFNAPFRWRRYPATLSPHRAVPAGAKLQREDWAHALRHIPTLADVTEDELIELHALAVEHARGERREVLPGARWPCPQRRGNSQGIRR